MLDFDKIGRVLVSTFGALVLTTTMVGAAVGPARIAETSPVTVSAQVQSHA